MSAEAGEDGIAQAKQRARLRALPLALIFWGTAAMALDIGVARLTYGAVLTGIAQDLRLSYTVLGILSAVNLAAYLVGTLAAPRLGRMTSMPLLACLGHGAVALGAAWSGIAIGPVSLGAGRVLMGLGAGVGLVGLFVVVFERTEVRLRPTVSAFIWSGIGFALVLTGLFLPLTLGPGEWRRAFLVAAVVGAAATFGLRPRRMPKVGSSASHAVPAATHPHRAGVAQWLPMFGAYFMFGVGYIAYSTFAGARLAAGGASPGVIAASWTVYGAATIAGCAATALLLALPVARHLALTAALGCGAFGCWLVGLEGAVFPLLASLFVGLGLASTPAIITAYVRQRSDEPSYPRLFSLATASLGVGQLVGPVVAGALADRLGSPAVTAFATTAYAAGTALALIDARRASRS
jgi:MFS family permease